MRITTEFPLRTRRAILTAGGAALVGCATLGAVSLGVASAQSSATSPPTLSTTGNAVFVTSDSADLKQRQDKFVATLAGKLGVSSDKLRQALKDTQQEVGPVPLLFGAGKEAIGVGGTAISITSELAPAARVIGISEDQLKLELAGKSLSDVAKAHNADLQKVSNAIKSAREADLDSAVQSGKLPAELAKTIKSHLDREIEMLMRVVRPADGGLGEFNIRIVQRSDSVPGT